MDWRQLDLKIMTLRELKALAAELHDEIGRRQEEGRRWLKEHGRGLVERRGPMYRNPHNSRETWSGKGKRPAWVERALAEGHDLESLIADTDRDLPDRRRRSGD